MLIIKEFADSKREIERELKAKTKQIIEHLFKLYLMPNRMDRSHWKSEIANFLDSVSKLSGKNKFPTFKQIYAWTYGKYQDVITDNKYIKVMVDNIIYDYKISEIRKTYPQICEEFDFICQQYFKWISEKLSSIGIVSRPEIFKKLDEIIPLQ